MAPSTVPSGAQMGAHPFAPDQSPSALIGTVATSGSNENGDPEIAVTDCP